jgi:phage/plasmid-associated DNA primase
MVDNEIQFDMNKNLFGCKNGVYDIVTDEFRNYRFDDYVTMSCGFDFEDLRKRKLTEEDNNRFNEINVILDQVFPDKEVQKYVMLIFASGVSGKSIEKFFIFNGAGGNGKGLLDEFLCWCLGDYFYEASVTLLTQKTQASSSPNPDKAYIDKKRLLLFKEPDEHTRIMNSNMKDMTGGGKIKARGLYSSKTDVYLHNTTIMECNKRPKLFETPTKGDIRRLADIHFGSSFITDESEVDEIKHVYLQDPLLKETEWKDNHRVYFLNMLFENLQELKKKDYIIDHFMPQCVIMNIYRAVMIFIKYS